MNQDILKIQHHCIHIETSVVESLLFHIYYYIYEQGLNLDERWTFEY